MDPIQTWPINFWKLVSCRASWGLICLLGWALGPCWQRAVADVTLGAYGGYAPMAQLTSQRAQTLKLSLFPLAGELGYVLGANSLISLHGGFHLLHGRVVYRDAGTTYAGVLNAQGAGLGLAVWFGSVQALVQGVTYMQTILSVRSEIHAAVNEGTYKHSNLITYRGQGGVLGRFSLLTEMSDKQFARYTRMRVGVALESFQQTFSRYTLNINTNDPNIGPGGVWRSPSAASLQYVSISLLCGFIF